MLDAFERQNLARLLNTPLQIGTKTIANRLVLAPMAGLGHVAFREVIQHFGGCGLLFTGMLNARSLPTENPRTSPLFRWNKEELPNLAGQIFGSNPDEMAAAAQRLEQEGFFGVDINMGCSVAAIVKRGAGAALLRQHDATIKMVLAVRKAVKFPLLVKMRTGWNNDPAPAIDLALALQDIGVDAITFHPRVSPDRRTRPPNLEHLRQFKAALSIPVLGNGDIFAGSNCLHMLQKTGCDGVSIGRLAVARPWIFQSLSNGQDELAHLENNLQLSANMVLQNFWHHYEPGLAIKLYKKYLVYFSANYSFGNRIYGQLGKAASESDLQCALQQHFDARPTLSKRLNPMLLTM